MAVGYAYSQLRDIHLAEDVAQEAFVGAYLGLSRLQDPEAFPGWFRRVVHTHCHRLTRRKKDRVLTAIEDLPEPERSVTTLFYISGKACLRKKSLVFSRYLQQP
jgi:DNA-directed RNA polymerase specialized sigma24 family protein